MLRRSLVALVCLSCLAYPCIAADGNNAAALAKVAEMRQMIIDGAIVIPVPLYGGDYVLP